MNEKNSTIQRGGAFALAIILAAFAFLLSALFAPAALIPLIALALIGLAIGYRPLAIHGAALLFAFCFLLFAFQSKAGEATFDSVTLSIPSTLAAGTTTNLATPLFIDCSKQNVQAFELSSTWSTAGEPTGQTNLTYTLCPSVSGVRFDTNHSVSLVAANWSAIGVTNTTVTNLTANGIRGWYITKIVNSSAGGIATNQFRYSVKIQAP